jgi:hypothetical protein
MKLQKFTSHLLSDQEQSEDKGEEGKGFDDAECGETFTDNRRLFCRSLNACRCTLPLKNRREKKGKTDGKANTDTRHWGKCACQDAILHQEHQDKTKNSLRRRNGRHPDEFTMILFHPAHHGMRGHPANSATDRTSNAT